MSDTLKLPTVTKFPPMPVCKPPRVEEEYEEFVRDMMREICRTLRIPYMVINKMYGRKYDE